jgi:hypothetical protein
MSQGLGIPNIHLSSSDTSEDNDDPRLSEIRIVVNTPIIITGDGNQLSIDTAVNASRVAAAVTTALRSMSSPAGGVPMIDGDGRPRPIYFEVTAEIKVEGSNNVVGDKAVLSNGVLGQIFRKEGDDSGVAEEEGKTKLKRERDDSNELAVDSKKRVRRE